MDMLFFPHNSMFAAYVPEKKIFTYVVKINGNILPITKKAWWKKDFLESNAAVYGAYYEHGQHTLLEDYIKSKINDTALQQFFLDKFTAGKVSPEEWAAFYIRFAGMVPRPGDKIELTRYQLSFDGRPRRVDSLNIFNFRQP